MRNPLRAVTALIIVATLLPAAYDGLMFQPVAAPHMDWEALPAQSTYYDGQCTIPYLYLGGDVETWLRRLTWARPYEADVWDCSNRAAFLEWTLQNCGVDTVLKHSLTHTWVSVEIDGVWQDYDVNAREFIPDNVLEAWRPCFTKSDVYAARAAYRSDEHPELLDVFAEEWVWWRQQ